jgi:hypothetical protein
MDLLGAGSAGAFFHTGTCSRVIAMRNDARAAAILAKRAAASVPI